jgi:hypothetical protein
MHGVTYSPPYSPSHNKRILDEEEERRNSVGPKCSKKCSYLGDKIHRVDPKFSS